MERGEKDPAHKLQNGGEGVPAVSPSQSLPKTLKRCVCHKERAIVSVFCPSLTLRVLISVVSGRACPAFTMPNSAFPRRAWERVTFQAITAADKPIRQRPRLALVHPAR